MDARGRHFVALKLECDNIEYTLMLFQRNCNRVSWASGSGGGPSPISAGFLQAEYYEMIDRLIAGETVQSSVYQKETWKLVSNDELAYLQRQRDTLAGEVETLKQKSRDLKAVKEKIKQLKKERAIGEQSKLKKEHEMLQQRMTEIQKQLGKEAEST